MVRRGAHERAVIIQQRRRAFVARTLLCALVAALASQATPAQGRYPGPAWQRITAPDELGWSSERLGLARKYASTIDTAAVVIVVNGVVLDEWGETTRRFNVHSIRKSILSALYGIHVHEGRLNLSKTMTQVGIDDNPPLSKTERQATVLDLLKARSGVYHLANYETPSMAASRPRRGSHAPGTFWYYNNWDFNALGTIFERETGTKIFEEFARRIARPLEMEDFRLEDGAYVGGPQSIHPAYPFRLTARDLARFGLLYLRGGEWGGRQIVPREWVEESTRSHSDVGEAGGYGYMWWVSVDGRHFPFVTVPDGTFSARGAGGHYLAVFPRFDLVVVHRVNTDEREREVTAAQFGRLLKLILSAAPRRR